MTIHITSVVEKSPGTITIDDLKKLADFFRRQDIRSEASDYDLGLCDAYRHAATEVDRIADNLEHGLNMEEALVTL